MLDVFIKYILGEFRMIADAPVSFVVAVVAGSFLISLAMDWRYGGLISGRDTVISTKEAELKLAIAQRDDYREKLGGASPDQAKARIDALEKRLARVEPRRLDQEQRAKLSSRLHSSPPNTPIQIMHDGACADCNQYAADFNAILSAAGWQTRATAGLGIGGPLSPKGLTLRIYDVGNSSPEGILLAQAFEAAAIPFDEVHQSKPTSPMPSPNASVIITARAAF